MDAPNPFKPDNDDEGIVNLDEQNPFGAKSRSSTNQIDQSQGNLNETKEEKLARLKARADSLRRRLADAQQQQAEIQNSPQNQPNWPPYVPFLYIDIEHDIPRAAQKCVQYAKNGIILSLSHVFINFIASCSISGLPSYSHATGIVFSIIYCFLNLYLTISLCFNKLYASCCKHDIPFSFILYQFILIGFLLYQFVGFPNSGSVGLATFLDLIAKSKSGWSKFISFVNSMIILACAIIQVIVLQQSQKYQKVSGVDDTTTQRINDMPNLHI